MKLQSGIEKERERIAAHNREHLREFFARVNEKVGRVDLAGFSRATDILKKNESSS